MIEVYLLNSFMRVGKDALNDSITYLCEYFVVALATDVP